MQTISEFTRALLAAVDAGEVRHLGGRTIYRGRTITARVQRAADRGLIDPQRHTVIDEAAHCGNIVVTLTEAGRAALAGELVRPRHEVRRIAIGHWVVWDNKLRHDVFETDDRAECQRRAAHLVAVELGAPDVPVTPSNTVQCDEHPGQHLEVLGCVWPHAVLPHARKANVGYPVPVRVAG